MTSSKVTNSSEDTLFNVFEQKHYNNTFYYCDKDHPFIAFTACFCPLCEKVEEAMELSGDCIEMEEALENTTVEYQELYIKVKNHSPELLI
jgi:hypothetical protein